MKTIGLTGGIGSGKSLIAHIFNLLGIATYDSDLGAKRLMNDNGSVKESITELFGNDAYTAGSLNRGFVAQQVFNNPTLLEKLNGIVHPAVGRDFQEWKNRQPANMPYVLKESALIFEADIFRSLDQTILVIAPQEIRIDRVMRRNGMAREQVVQRMENQWPDEQKIPLADFIVVNDEQRGLIRQVMEIHRQLI